MNTFALNIILLQHNLKHCNNSSAINVNKDIVLLHRKLHHKDNFTRVNDDFVNVQNRQIQLCYEYSCQLKVKVFTIFPFTTYSHGDLTMPRSIYLTHFSVLCLFLQRNFWQTLFHWHREF